MASSPQGEFPTWLRRSGYVATFLCSGFVAWLIASTAIFAHPSNDTTETADVIFVIGPPTHLRLLEATRLLSEGVSNRLLVSVYRQKYTKEGLPVCEMPETDCLIAAPSTTKGEAQLLQDYLERTETESALVLTFTPHVARTRYIFERCVDAHVSVRGVDEEMDASKWAFQYAYQTAAFAKAVITPCDIH